MALEDPVESVIDAVVDRMRPGMSLLFITGAGLSADSGLPTYRGVGGLYSGQAPPEGMAIEEILSGTMFAERPALTWRYLLQVAEACRGATFNRGHAVVAEMEAGFPRVLTLTQNVDGFHHAAGSRQVIDIHGDIHQLICTHCPWAAKVADYDHLSDLPPRCPDCGAVIRPDVVLFGEWLPAWKVEELRHQLAEGFDMVLTVGTSGQFPYIQEPVHLARSQGVPTVEINPDRTELSDVVAHRVPARAAVALDALWSRYRAIHGD